MNKRASHSIVIAVWGLAGCGGAGATPEPALEGATAQPAEATAQPVATSTAPTAPAAAAASATTPATPTAAAPSTLGAAGAAAPAAPPAMAAPTTPAGDPASAPEGTCQERRVSYAKPCTSNPDPCAIASGWAGDEYCLLPPAPEQGIQIHIGPKDYKDMAEVAKYVIQPGDEFNNSVIAHIPLTQNVWWNHITVHMRPGSHHWISSVVSGKPEEKFYADTSCGASQIGSLGGGQNLIYDNPPGGEPAPENVGLGRELPGDSSLCMNLHAYNFTDVPQLREIWINLYTVPEEEVTQRAKGIGMVGGLGLNLGPKQSKESTYQGTFMEDGRIIQLFGHRHVWTPHFAAWLNDRLIYDSWSWEESATFNYDSLTMNPPIMSDKKVDGAVSGVLPVKAGDVLKFTCFIENDSDKTIGFSNELYDGEMCNLWGSAVGTSVSGTFL